MGLVDRRTFLQKAVLALVSVGGSEVGIDLLSKNTCLAKWLQPYVETLAQTTNRKLALLVGINEYAQKAHLHGCINDVELQKELLIYRFGFKDRDICILSDREATRENIETAFLEHLTEQATSNDVALFHFSGYGSQVKISSNADPTQLQLVNSLVPIDATIPSKGSPATNDLLENTLFDLGRSLNSNNLITVLDTSFQTTKEILQGNYRVRSYSQISERSSSEELAFQAQLQRNISGKGLIAYLQTANNPGLILAAAEQNQIALEGTWNNFSAGFLTYALTRYLWQTMPQSNIYIALQQTADAVNNWSEKQQQPKVIGNSKSSLADDIPSQKPLGGEGFITGLDTKGMVNLKLTALPVALINNYREESCFTVVNSSGNNLLQLRSREGITAKAQFLPNNNLTEKETFVGKIIRETIRVLPRNLGLSIALDNHLERIERVDATSAFANIIAVKNSAIAGEAYGDCLLGKIALMVDKTNQENPQAVETPSHSYGLYTPRGNLIPHTPGEANEVIKLAVSRLEPYFNQLLAAKWLELTVNENSSTIPVSAILELATKNTPLITKAPLRINPDVINNSIPSLNHNSDLRLKIENKSDRDLFGILIGVDSEVKFMTLYTPQKATNIDNNTASNSLKIPSQNQFIIPQSNQTWQWKINQSLGIAKMYLILSIQPFENTLKLIEQQATTKLDDPQIINLLNPLTIVQTILQDLHNSSAVSSAILADQNTVYALDVNNWASFKFIYDVQ
jgi:hypothetical protein